MAEWFKATVLKTVVPKGTGGSNPSCSVRFIIPQDSQFYAVSICERLPTPTRNGTKFGALAGLPDTFAVTLTAARTPLAADQLNRVENLQHSSSAQPGNKSCADT